ncbi:cell division protein FtsQ [Psychromonas sp. CNPT3]|uniref:cell division protein FtsQ/DivIB n=1 Tax=Psychromonas sp. CNPT3 TaxID=314282 RepID=UPI00006E76B3|nr:cell division protein FtsQ/DivIB [Psychromonas sp. CNPT3]AGH80644.1 cell division protein FtsQ [Psychromonas sp. CNPT3]
MLFFIGLVYLIANSFIKIKTWLTDEQSLPLTELILTGEKKHVLLQDVRNILIKQKDRLNFFTLEIAEIQHQLEALPWVYSASIRKRWPATIKIHIVEQSIVAIWNDKNLLNRFGEIVYASPKGLKGEYVSLYGKDEFANDVLISYKRISQLLKVNDFEIASLENDARQATRIVLKNSFKLNLGQEQKLDRIQNFLKVFPLLERKYDIDKIDYVDLRYDTGFAIGWKQKKK